MLRLAVKVLLFLVGFKTTAGYISFSFQCVEVCRLMSSAVCVLQCSHSESYQHLLMPVKFLVFFLWLAVLFTAGFLLPLCPLVLGFSLSCYRWYGLPVKLSEPLKMGGHYVWTHEPLSWFPDSTLSVEFLKRLAGVTSCNTLCNSPAALTKHSSPLALAGLFLLCFFFPLPCMRSFLAVMPVPCVIKNGLC